MPADTAGKVSQVLEQPRFRADFAFARLLLARYVLVGNSPLPTVSN